MFETNEHKFRGRKAGKSRCMFLFKFLTLIRLEIDIPLEEVAQKVDCSRLFLWLPETIWSSGSGRGMATFLSMSGSGWKW